MRYGTYISRNERENGICKVSRIHIKEGHSRQEPEIADCCNDKIEASRK